MPAGLPGDSAANNLANPTLGRAIVFDPLSGPKGAPLDFDSYKQTLTGPVAITATRASTGALSTGIGFGPGVLIGLTAPASIYAAGYNDNSVPGDKNVTYAPAPPNGVVTATQVDSTYMYIGGGRSIANVVSPDKFTKPFVPSPYTAGVELFAAGNGGSRDAGAGPAFTGFATRMVTATGAVANGAAVEAGSVNRTGVAMVTGQSTFGSSTAAAAAPS
jgi:hypothetical protein